MYNQTASFYRKIREIRAEIATMEGQQVQLRQSETYLKARKREYEKARFDADQDIELESEQASEMCRKLVKVVELIDRRCHDRRLADAIHDSVDKEFAFLDATKFTIR